MQSLTQTRPNAALIGGWLGIYLSFTALCYMALTAGISTAIYLAALFYLGGFFHLYAQRLQKFGFFLLMSFSYALLFGIPSVAWLLREPLNDESRTVFLLGLLSIGNLLIMLSHYESIGNYGHQTRFTFKPNRAFLFFFLLIALAQAYKLRIYFGILSESEFGHLAIWLEGDALRSAVPAWARILSGGSLIAGILGLALFRSRPLLQFACIILIISDIVIGIRNKGFFGILAAIYILSLFARTQASRIFHNISSPLLLVVVFFILSAVSYLREGFDIPMTEYSMIVLDSLASIVNGLLEVISNQRCLDSVDRSLVITQLRSLLGVGDGTQLSSEFNYCVTGDPNPLTGLSSSLVLEALLVSGSLWPLVVGLYFMALYAVLHLIEGRRTILSLSILCALAPAFLYTLRAELVQPIVFTLKSLPFLLLTGFLMQKTPRFRPYDQTPRPLLIGRSTG